jgi:hypothetical protein
MSFLIFPRANAGNKGSNQMLTLKNSEVNVLPRMVSSLLPERMIFRMAEGARCPCGSALRCDPEPLDWPFSFRIICSECHHDVIVFERRP